MSAPDKLRVLFPITDLGKGGAERFLLDLCHALARRGDVEIRVATLYEANGYVELSSGLPVVPMDYQTFSLRRPVGTPRWTDLLQSFRPHIVHSHRFLGEFLTAQGVTNDIAYVCHGHDNMVQFERASLRTFLDRTRFTMWLETRHLLKHKYGRVRTAFIANSEHTRAYYETVLPRSMQRDVVLLHYGFDYRRFRAPGPRCPADGSPLRLINVGSFVDKKNQQLAIRIGEVLAARNVAFRIDLLGDGPTRAGLEERVRTVGLQDRIRFRGNVDRVEERLREADIYLHTARYEPFGLVLLEAMAGGLPCVILNGLGNRELIVEGQNGHLFDVEDPIVFADRIQALAADPVRFTSMSAFAIQFAARFDIDEAAANFVRFYRDWYSTTAGASA